MPFFSPKLPSSHNRWKKPPQPKSLTGRNPATLHELEYTPDEVEFMMAMERYKRTRERPYPTCREVLAVARALGYRKVT